MTRVLVSVLVVVTVARLLWHDEGLDESVETRLASAALLAALWFVL